MKEYKSGEYCKAKCPYQQLIDSGVGDRIQIKKYHCLTCEAKKFHEYLEENGYEILKKL